MELTDKIAAVGRMQRYILAYIDAPITLDALAQAAGYSKYHALRIFKELTGPTPFHYAGVSAAICDHAGQIPAGDSGGELVCP